MITANELTAALSELGIERSQPVLAHASLSAFGSLEGGAQTMLDALLQTYDTLIMPTFTYKTMLVPEVGPADNGITYGSRQDANQMAEFFTPNMPADRLMGIVPETLRRHPTARRSMHPILSFSGVNASHILESQSYAEPLAPVGVLLQLNGWALLLGVDHTVNTSIHYAERLVGRKQLIRWALTPDGVVECPGFPSCSDGFESIAEHLVGSVRSAQIGPAFIQAIPLVSLIQVATAMITADPLALLCDHSYCERCQAVIDSVHLLTKGSNNGR
jgi:aminoglycoside 3-N-acetyltransferase